MKALLISPLLILTLFIQPKPESFSPFINYVTKTHRITAEIRKNCNWQYAIIKVNVSADNRVSNYEVLNEASASLKNSFAFLEGYQFDKKLAIKQRPIVFFYTIENENDDCDGPVSIVTPSNAASKWLSFIQQQSKNQPQTIFLYNVIIDKIYATVH